MRNARRSKDPGAGAIFQRALTSGYFATNTNLAQARTATEQVADELYPGTKTAVSLAWGAPCGSRPCSTSTRAKNSRSSSPEDGGGGSGTDDGEEPAGCCSSADDTPTGAWLWLGVALLLYRRRRR